MPPIDPRENERQWHEKRAQELKTAHQKNKGSAGAKPKGAKAGDEPVKRFRLLSGAHIGRDMSGEPELIRHPMSGEVIDQRYPSKQYMAGDVVEDTADLVDICGSNKFQYLGDVEGQRGPRTDGGYTDADRELLATDPAPRTMREGPSKAPHGQVSTGWQEAAPTPPPGQETGVTGGALSPAGHEALQAKREEVKAQTQVADDQKSQGAKAAEQQEQRGQQAGQQPQQRAGKRELPANLNSMSARELKQYAQDEEIDLKGATTRDDVLKAIRSHG